MSNILLCECGQDHSVPLITWCDRSISEIERDYFRREVERLKDAIYKTEERSANEYQRAEKLKDELDHLRIKLIEVSVDHPCYTLSKELEAENQKLKDECDSLVRVLQDSNKTCSAYKESLFNSVQECDELREKLFEAQSIYRMKGEQVQRFAQENSKLKEAAAVLVEALSFTWVGQYGSAINKHNAEKLKQYREIMGE